MLKRAMLWLVPLVVLVVLAVGFVVAPALSSRAATINRPVAGSNTTPTPTSGTSTNVQWIYP
jgi:hypothetical protein